MIRRWILRLLRPELDAIRQNLYKTTDIAAKASHEASEASLNAVKALTLAGAANTDIQILLSKRDKKRGKDGRFCR